MSAVSRLTKPDPELADDLIRFEPLEQRHVPGLTAAVQDDQDIVRYTRVPAGADRAFVSSWIRRYEARWEDGSGAGFAVVNHAGEVLGFAAIVQLDLRAGEAELGYLVGRKTRGRGIATRSVGLLTRWSFDELELERLELLITPGNVGSERVAERNGFRLEGVLRSKHIDADRRADFGVWSRLRAE